MIIMTLHSTMHVTARFSLTSAARVIGEAAIVMSEFITKINAALS